ncbi:hypothetical protein LZ023_10725 [Pseudomonas silvicola]|nr:hypothetical protein LZ023_10725 [Pseudomonas silvicola]
MTFSETVLVTFSSLQEAVLACFSGIDKFGGASTNYGSLVAALIAAALLFIVREFFIKAANYSGAFYIKTTVEETARNPYRGMEVFYTLVVYSDGHIVAGTSEKTGEICVAHSMEYEGKNKRRGVVSGVVERNYFRSSVMNIHIIEQGQEREYTTYMSIKVRRYRSANGVYSGTFYSTAANSKGSVLCGRAVFSEHPTGYLQSQSTLGSPS